MPNSLRLHELQHARLPCPLLSPWVCSNLYPLSQWCHPTISSSVAPFSPALNLPSIGVFSKQLALRVRCPKYWSFNFSISLSREYSGLISFGTDWFDILAVQRDSQECCPASSLRCSAFFTVWLSHLHDYWNNHSFDSTDLCWQSDVFACQYTVLVIAFMLLTLLP